MGNAVEEQRGEDGEAGKPQHKKHTKVVSLLSVAR